MKKFIALLLVAVMCFAMAACGGSEPAPAAQTQAPAAAPAAAPATTPSAPAAAPETADYDEVTFKLAHVNAVDNACHLAYEKWNELLQEKSEGKIAIDIYPASSLYNQEDSYDACQLGDLDMAQADISGLSRAAASNVFALPMLMTSYEKAANAFYGEAGTKVNNMIADEYGFLPLGWMWNGFREMVTNDPVNSLAACKGYKLRVPGIDLYLNIFVPMGFECVQTAWGEAYNSMQSGLVDGVETTVQAIYQQGFAELGGNVTKTNHVLSVIGPIINTDKWNGLTKDTQDLLLSTWQECQAWANEKVISQEDEFYTQMEADGVNLMTWEDPQELMDLFQPKWDEFAAAGGYTDLLAEVKEAIK